MAYERPKTHTTPRGIAGWVCVTKPSTKFNPVGEYSIDLALTAEAAAPMQAALEDAAAQAKAMFLEREKDPKKKAALAKFDLHVPGSEQLDDAGEPTGNITFKFKQIAVITPKDKSKSPFEVKIGLFDAKNKPVPASTSIGRGTEMKVAYEVIPFAMPATKKVGIKLRLKAVQILNLVKYTGGGNAEAYGFGAEDGYTSDDASPSDEATGGETTGTGDGTEF